MENDRHIEDMVDLALEQTFPASDPPSFMAASGVIGARRSPEEAKVPLRRRRKGDVVT